MITLLIPPNNNRVLIEPNAVIFMLEVDITFGNRNDYPGVQIFFITGNNLVLPDADRNLVDFINKHRRDSEEYRSDDDFTLQLR